MKGLDSGTEIQICASEHQRCSNIQCYRGCGYGTPVSGERVGCIKQKCLTIVIQSKILLTVDHTDIIVGTKGNVYAISFQFISSKDRRLCFVTIGNAESCSAQIQAFSGSITGSGR